MNPISSGLAGFAAAERLLDKGAAQMQGLADPAGGAVSLMLAKVQASASAAVTRTESDVEKRVLDVFA